MSRRAPLIAAIVFVLLAALAVILLVLPKMGDVKDAKDQLQQAEEQEVVLQTELSRLQAAEENVAELRRELARFRRAVPPVADLPGLINELQTAADVAGVDFFSIAPGDPVPAAGAAEIPSQVQVNGSFFAVDEFLFRLETLPRAAKVVSITIAPGPDDLPQISIQMEARFYTTDTDAGPGSAPPEAGPAPAEFPAPTPSPSPGESPAPAGSPATSPSPVSEA